MRGIRNAPYAATADVHPSTGPANSGLKMMGIMRNVEPLPMPVVMNSSMNSQKNGHQ
jgi:hypothetical protein